MNGEENRDWLFALLGVPIIAWFSILIAPAIGGGLPVMMPKMTEAFQHPFRLSWCERSLPTLCILLGVYCFVLLI